jgi:myo-inositol catabolism protein IolS
MGGHGWGEVSRQNLVDAINRALEIGINFFDTADIYGLGEGETLLGDTLGVRRKDVVIATKFGVRIEDGKTFYDNSPDWIDVAVENSLKRLKTSYIDIYQIHYRDNTPISIVLDKLEELRANGKIRYYGLSNISSNDINDLLKYKSQFVTFQNEFSLANRDKESDMLFLSKNLDITPMTWGSLGQGILSGKYDENSVFSKSDRRARKEYVNFHGDKLIKNLSIVEKMKNISLKYDKPVSAIAIRWILDYLPQSIVIAGIKDKNQLEMNASALGWQLEKKDLDNLERVSKE